MRKAIKKWFDWTPSDVRAWEKMRQPGFWHFVLGYGVIGFGLFLFILMGGATLFTWILAPFGLAGLFFQLAVTAGLCLLGGLVTGVLTWWLEDGIYQRIKKSRST
jgi:hypothetical protein